MTTFQPGDPAVRRDVLDGKVYSAAPHRVVADSGAELVLARWPGIEMLAPTTWVSWLRTGDDAVRKRGIPDLARRSWELDRWVWRDTATLSWFGVDPDFSVHRFYSLSDEPSRWYVNFERPMRRTAIGIDTLDLLLDIVIAPDLSGWAWKDEDEYDHARRLGLVTDAEHARVRAARERAVALIEERGGPFAGDWAGWRVPDDWRIPVLPRDVLAVCPVNGLLTAPLSTMLRDDDDR